MRIHYGKIDVDPSYIAWVECSREDIDEVRKIFPGKEYEILVGIRSNYDPLTCPYHMIDNPPPSTYGFDIHKRG